MNLSNTKIRSLLVLALTCGGWFSASAQTSNTLVTFSVDMSAQVTGGTFVPGTDTVAARGTFNNWGQFFLTNDASAANPNVYTGTTNDVSDANGGKLQYKFWNSNPATPNTGWENTSSGQNRCVLLPSTNGAPLVLPTCFFGDAGTPETSTVTFQVDMAQQINIGAFDPTNGTVEVRGGFNSWSGGVNVLTNDPSILRTNQYGLVTSNVYVGIIDITASPGAAQGFKFVIAPGTWENLSAISQDGGGNRYFSAVTQKLPIVYFNDAPYAPVATVQVTFQVDMTAQVIAGNFDPNSGWVELRGGFNNWGSPQILCTNDPSGANTNLYTAVIPVTDGIGATVQYKFWALGAPNNGWEVTPNRTFTVPSSNKLALPAVFFSDTNPSDLLPADTLVTFSVSMTNAMATDGHAFDPSVDFVFVNGVPNGFANWNQSLPQLTNNPVGSGIYSIELLVPKGSPVMQTYKYSINGPDNEAPQGNNHVDFIRTVGSYTFPMDTFGNPLSGISFGNLEVRKSDATHTLISWLGRPGVHLQTRTNLTTGAWVEHLETDGMSFTNWPSGGSSTFFRLIRP